MKVKIDSLCICGHPRFSHSEHEDSPLCVDCANQNKGWDIMWHEFKLDNLKYLERKCEEK